uniref:Angiopoietin-related protein 3 isoform X2 n=1 Tax=Pogona vitticeps TaxID=103695 RepID=A0A6J0UTY7_9SAUR
MKIVLVSLLLISPVISVRTDGDDSIPPEPKSRFAMLDDVQLLANGLLHLGHGLKDFAIKTKGQMDNIFQKLNIFDRSFYEISQQTNEIKEEEEQLKKITSKLQANNEEIRNASLELNSKIEVLSQEKIQLQDQVGRLEEKLIKLFQMQLEVQQPEELVSLKRSSPGFQDDKQILFPSKEDETRNIKLNRTSKLQDHTDSSWTVIQNRSDGSLDFNQTWENYLNGFGNLGGEFWLGLHKIYSIVDQADYLLRIELEDWKANKRYIEYTITIGGPETDYTILLFRITGNIPNALPEQKEIKFSTKDHRNNTERKLSCPESDSGGWWYSACGETNLNGKYIRTSSKGKLQKRRKGLYWKPQNGRPYLLKSTKLMIHPTDFENFE